MTEKFQPPRGTKDFLPEDMVKRQFVINTIRKKFEDYGFDTIDTPAFENWDLLTLKCGEEIKNQIYYFKDKSDRELGLRFDLTVPMSRLVANNPQLPKPFKRYYIGPVWRYEDVKTGRRREFYQCDVDTCGTESMEADAECVACAVDCLKELGFKNFAIKLNNRKILEALVELADIPKDIMFDVFRAIDKIEKIRENGVKEELEKLNLSDKQINKLFDLITIKGSPEKVLKQGEKLLKGVEIGKEGLKELKDFYESGKSYGFSEFVVIDFSLARGLDYYTGPTFEISAGAKKDVGSIAGGGRYDNLIELFGGSPTPATGISLGIERIIQVMEEQEMFDVSKTKTKLFIVSVNDSVRKDCIKIAQELRKVGISTEIDIMGRNIRKQLEYANSLEIPYVIVVGPKEIESKKFVLKDMKTGKEVEATLESIKKKLE